MRSRAPGGWMKRLLLIALASTACVTTAQEGDQMRQDIAALRADLKKEIETASTDRQKVASEQQQRAKALRAALDRLPGPARKGGADLGVNLKKAKNAVAAPRG